MADASAPQSERYPPMTLRWMTAGHRSRSELLLVGSTSSQMLPLATLRPDDHRRPCRPPTGVAPTRHDQPRRRSGRRGPDSLVRHLAMIQISWRQREKRGAKTRATIDMSLIRMFIAGPDVSLNGSPIVSPITAA